MHRMSQHLLVIDTIILYQNTVTTTSTLDYIAPMNYANYTRTYTQQWQLNFDSTIFDVRELVNVSQHST